MTGDNRPLRLFYTGIFIGLIPLANIITILLNQLTSTDPITDIDVDLSVLLTFVTVCLAPAFFEELLFRGLLQRYLEKYGAVAAVVITSILFASLHIFNPVGMLSIFLLSLALSAAMQLFGNLRFCIFLHLLNNCFAYTVYLFNYYLSENIAFILTVALYILFALLSFITFLIGKNTCPKQIAILWKKRLNLPKKR